jgi:hypothetical protein
MFSHCPTRRPISPAPLMARVCRKTCREIVASLGSLAATRARAVTLMSFPVQDHGGRFAPAASSRPGTYLANLPGMPAEGEPPSSGAKSFILPRYLRFAQALALVSSGVAVGVAAGAATVSTSGCVQNCTGTPCPGDPPYRPPPGKDASSDVTGDAAGVAFGDASVDGGKTSGDASGGGPRPAPLLPRAWNA